MQSDSNRRQHAETLQQVPAGELASYLSWFRTLPLWIDLDGLRVVHACWDGRMMDHVGDAKVDDDFLVSSCLEGGRLFGPVETLLKGKEARLPPGVTITDKDGHERSATRVKWFESPEGMTYGEYLMEPIDCDLRLPKAVIDEALPYAASERPVFIGHYWMRGSRPELLASNVACVDWSVAKGGFLCAYRWDGERVLDPAKFAWKSSR